ncbi:MAG: NAD-dependent epimerase/dehydratase family protein [Candidatus Omnitrophota bacterium]|nr:NAD-dependent epimerase/dehydratase family protein [Candidatus Omnitrophota bacterium]
MADKKNILVTGAAGFIGRHLVKALKSRRFSVYTFDKIKGYDVCRKNSLAQFLNKRIEIVFHLAGQTYVPDSWNRAGNFYKTNTLGTQNVLEFCRQAEAKLIYLSAYVYGPPKYLPIDEKHPLKPNNPYAHSKLLAEEICRLYADVMGVKAVILRPFNIYGPAQRECFLIPMLLKQIKQQGRIIVKDDTPKRDYLYIDDLIRACILAMNYQERFEVFNVGYGSSFSVKEIVEIICQCNGRDVPWESLKQPRKNEISETVADCRLIKERLGWRPKVGFKEGILKTMGFV